MKLGSFKAALLALLCAGFLLLPTGAVSEWAFRETVLAGLILFLILLEYIDFYKKSSPNIKKSLGPIEIPRAFLAWGLFILWLGVTGILTAVHPGEFRLEMRRLWLLSLSGGILVFYRPSASAIIRSGILASAGVAALWVLVQRGMGVMRPSGPQVNPNIMASILIASALFLLPVAFRDLLGSRRPRGFAALSLVFLFLGAAGFTGSRAAVLSFFFAFSCSLIILGPSLISSLPKGRREMRWPLIILGGIVILVVAAQYPSLQRLWLGAQGDHLSMGRIFIYGSALQMFSEAPLWGLGWGMFGSFYDSYKDSALWPYTTRYPHSSWLHALIEGGLPALMLVGLGWWWTAKDLLAKARIQPWAAGAFMAVLFLLVHGLIEENLYLSAPAFLALVLSTEGFRKVKISGQNLYIFGLLAIVVFASSFRARQGLSWLAQGQRDLAMEQYGPALANFQKAQTAMPGHVSPILGIAQSNGAMGNRAVAADHFEKALDKASRNIEIHLSAARFYLAIGSVAKAEKIAKAAVILDPQNPMTLVRTAQLFLESNLPHRALPFLEQANRLVPQWEVPQNLINRIGK